MSLYALNLFDLADNDDYRGYSKGLHPLRENGTRNCIRWAYERLEGLRPLLSRDGPPPG